MKQALTDLREGIPATQRMLQAAAPAQRIAGPSQPIDEPRAALGHRRTLLDAIAALRIDTGVKAPSADEATAPSATSVSPEDRAERRQVTVMFSAK